MNDLIVHQVNISHYRLIELSKLADQAKPFYDWVEKIAKKITASHKNLNDILMNASKEELVGIINACYTDASTEKPMLFDGIGRVYPHPKACYYFLAWIIRDAPQQRLSPLIARMRQIEKIVELTAQTDALANLIFEYRNIVKGFEWNTVREIVIDRLEGSRRSIKGHNIEANVRTSLLTAIQNYYAINNNYGKFEKVVIADKQIKIKNHTVDVSAELTPKDGSKMVRLLMPIKTRETEGGGHAHIFTRDIASAIRDLKIEVKDYFIAVVIIAENWSVTELQSIKDQIDMIFHFNMSPNKFLGFDEKSQIELNRFIQEIFDNYEQNSSHK